MGLCCIAIEVRELLLLLWPQERLAEALDQGAAQRTQTQ
jgi:hypothetical protein